LKDSQGFDFVLRELFGQLLDNLVRQLVFALGGEHDHFGERKREMLGIDRAAES